VAVAVRAGSERPPALAADEVRVSFLDVGQGDATLIEHGGTSVLVDTGPPEGQVVRRLEQSGVERLDALVITHAERDHEGAAPAVIARFAPRLVVDGGAGWPSEVQRALPAAVAAVRARVHAPAAGDVIALGPLRFHVLWPPARGPLWKAAGDPNDNAVVARVDAGGLSLLLTADAESDVTAPLDLGVVDVLKVAHHGSADAGLPALLARVRPRLAAIEVGSGNRHGHPAPSTLRALRVVPTLVRTDRDGTVRLRARGRRIWLESA
jgi:competence protein ComEC